MELTGKIISVGDEQQISDRFSKREIVVETGDQYPNPLPVEFANDKMLLVAGAEVGDQVTVSAHVNGRKWESPKGDRYFISLRGYKIDNPAERGRFEAPDFKPESDDGIPF